MNHNAAPIDFNFDERDFYRRGYMDGFAGKPPRDMRGYPENLTLSYIIGSFGGSLDACI